ncbi:MAG: type II secretion system F family protein [Thermoguttaceae bacterium]
MFFSARMPTRPLAALCRRLATALTAGIDARTVWAREARQAHTRAARLRLAAVSQAVGQGESVAAALAATGDFCPLLFREMAEVGEVSGHLGEVFAQLAEHYEGQAQLRRTFLGAIAWPMLQLFAALAIVGLLIWVTGLIGQMTGVTVDILGFGLVGNRGLAIYLAVVAAAAGLLLVFIRAASRGLVWVGPIRRAILRLPYLGTALRTLALARLAWSMHLTMNAGMELQRALRLSLRSTQNVLYSDQVEPLSASIAAGSTIYEAFLAAGCFPDDFLDAIEVGETSGKLVESMALLSRQYQEQARAAFATLTMLAGFAVWAVVALFIIVLIFRLFMFYLNAINQAMP